MIGRGEGDLDLGWTTSAPRVDPRRPADLAGRAAELAEDVPQSAGPLLPEPLAEELAQVDVLDAWNPPGPAGAGPGRAPSPQPARPAVRPPPIVSNELP